jgi:D-alanyl-D-alanine dipeptidase
VKGQGSCIFFHLWRNEKTPTVGCTAMPEPILVELLAWLDPEKSPLLVQLPKKERQRAAREWGVPEGDTPPPPN